MWKNIQINKQNVVTTTGKATLIKMPNKGNYANYKFWLPSKLVREGNNSYSVSIGYTDDFTFKLFKNGSGKYNSFDIIDETEIDVETFEEEFGCMESCTRKESTETYVKVDEPTKIEKEICVEEELKNE